MHPVFTLILLLLFLFVLWWYFGRQHHAVDFSSLKTSIFEFLTKAQEEGVGDQVRQLGSGASLGENVQKVEVSRKKMFDMPVSGEKEFDSRPEALCSRIMEEIYGKAFTKIRPEFLKNPETNHNLELDCYNDELKIAVEYSGYQHYVFPNRFHKTYDEFIKQVRRDQFKVEMCDRNGIYLITVPYWVPEFKLKEFIVEHLPENVQS